MVGRRTERERHGFGGGSGLIEERGVGNRKTGEIRDHSLKVEQGFEAPLRDLRLVGRVGGVPARILQHVALDHPGHVTVVVAQPEIGPEDLVLLGHRTEVRKGLLLGPGGGQIERCPVPDGRGDDRVDQGIQAPVSEHAEHFGDVVITGAQVTRNKRPEAAGGRGSTHVRPGGQEPIWARYAAAVSRRSTSAGLAALSRIIHPPGTGRGSPRQGRSRARH